MLQNIVTYDLNLCFKVITLIFFSFLLLVNQTKGGLSLMFFEMKGNSTSNSDNKDITMFSFPNVILLVISALIFALFMNVLGLSFFTITSRGISFFFFDSLIILALLLIKMIMVFMSSSVLDEHNLFNIFDKEFLRYMFFVSFVCLALIFIGLNYDLSSNYSLLFIIVLLQVLWCFRLSYVLLQSTTFNFLYFFSYLCSLEILPVLAVAIYVGII